MHFFTLLVATAPIAAATTATNTIASNISPTPAPDIAGHTGSFPSDVLDNAFAKLGIDLDSHSPEAVTHAFVDLAFNGISTTVVQYGPTTSKAFVRLSAHSSNIKYTNLKQAQEEVKTLVHQQVSTGQPPEIGPDSSLGLMVQQDPILSCETIASLLSSTLGLVSGLLGPVLGLVETLLGALGPVLGGLLVS
jgi:hypothetical protein